MEKLTSETKQCLLCMDIHTMDKVSVKETLNVETEKIDYLAKYNYCRYTNQFLETEAQMKINQFTAREAYNNKMKLVSS